MNREVGRCEKHGYAWSAKGRGCPRCPATSTGRIPMNAREELIAVMAEAWRESEAGTTTEAMVSVLDAALSSGLCVLVDDLEPAGVEADDGSFLSYMDGPTMAYEDDVILYRLPVLIAEEEKP